jgi:hypothetical protein
VWKKFQKSWLHRLLFSSFEVKKRAFFTYYKIGSANFESSWLKAFALQKLEAFDIVLGNWVGNPQKHKNPKNLYFHSLIPKIP